MNDDKDDAAEQSPSKTVSSLRSAFEGLRQSEERMSTAASPNISSRTALPPSAPKPLAAPKPSFKKQPPTPPAARRSLDTNRPTFARNGDSLDGPADFKNRGSSPLRSRSPPKARPLSLQVKESDLREPSQDPVASGRDLAHSRRLDTRDKTTLTTEPDAQGRLRSRSPANTLIKQDASRGHSLQAQPPVAGRHLPDRSSSKQPPPPVNRAGKPDINADGSILNTQELGLDIETKPTEIRSSPFSTPPESDGSAAAAEEPPPVPVASKPLVSTLTDPFETKQSPESDQLPKYPPRPPRAASTSRDPIQHPRRNVTGHAISAEEREAKPQLPPRREALVSETTAPIKHAPKYSRTSLEDATRSSALSQGFSMDPFPPRRTSHFSVPSAQDGAGPDSIRRTSMTPPPRTKPEPKLQLHKAFMKSSPVLTEPVTNSAPLTASSNAPSNTSTSQAMWPNSLKANRRPPTHHDGPRSIATGVDSRLMDAYGEYVCTTGSTTRVWHTSSGKLQFSMTHPESVKVTALAFKPARQIEKDGEFLWLATNLGEITEVEVRTGNVSAVNERTHSRREVVKIYRKAAELWTLDNDGKIYVWPSNDSGAPSLEHSIFNGKASRGVTSSVVIGNKLWLASGKSIRVFQPNIDPNKISFEVTTDPIIVTSGGEIVSSTYLPSDQDRVYLGHADGKISIYSRKNSKHVETLSVSLYKVSCLAGAGDYLWAGFNNGTIMLFDTKTRPWTTRKYWHPHTHPVVSIVADRSSIWKTGRYHVLSLGVDSTIGIWDGMLEDDWIQDDLRKRETEFCTYKDISALVMTWNAGAATPADLRYEHRNSNFFRELLRQDRAPDIIVFGFQELVDLEDKKLTAKSLFKSKKQDSYGHEHLSRVYREWRDYLTRSLDECMPQDTAYVQLHTASLVGLFTCVFVKSIHRSRIRDLVSAEVKTGMGGAYGNKGSLIVRFMLDDTSVCLANCHLAAGQSATVHRNQDVQAILGSETLPQGRRTDMYTGTYVYGGDGSMVMDHEICILNGDLNYRIDTMGRDTVIQAIKAKNLTKLLDRDQLLLSRRKNPDFRLRDFSEAPINFLPTYKYDVGTDNYDSSDKRRAPAWCDRILVRGDVAIKQLDYCRHEIRVSDHRPVSASFKMRIKTRDTTAFEDCRLASEDRFHAAKQAVADESKMEYLKTVFSVSDKEARQLVRPK